MKRKLAIEKPVFGNDDVASVRLKRRFKKLVWKQEKRGWHTGKFYELLLAADSLDGVSKISIWRGKNCVDRSMNPENRSVTREILARIKSGIPESDPKLSVLLAELESAIDQSEKDQQEAALQLEQFAQAYEKLTAPANRIGVLLEVKDGGQALIALGDSEFLAMLDPKFDRLEDLTRGCRILVNDAYAVVGCLPPHPGGGFARVAEVVDSQTLKVAGTGPDAVSRIVWISESVKASAIKKGDDVRIEPTGRFVVEHLVNKAQNDLFVEEITPIGWDQIGGQEEAIKLIRDTIEKPLLHPEIFERFDKKPVKGILLYGPPGCGKTLIGKATASNLAREYSEKKGVEVKECFMSISGPKILNMWLGESERMVREIFDVARRRSAEGQLVVIFIDEAESVLRTRSSGRYLNISNTVVPQFCAEMDGVIGLENVVVILTSNRPDYIDPAILRPERIDRKVKITRPDLNSARDILGIYLNDRLPIDPDYVAENDGEPSCARKALIEFALDQLWKKDKSTEFLEVMLRNGSTQTLYYKDLVTGALIKSVVDRAKEHAIERAIADPDVLAGLRPEDLSAAIASEFSEGEIFPKSDVVEDWLKLIDFEIEHVVGVRSVVQAKKTGWLEKNIL